MSFENNGTLQQWHITNTQPKIEKYNNTYKKWCLTKIAHLAEKCQNVICQVV